MAFSCILCGGNESVVKDTKDAKTSDALPIASCQSCGLVQLETVPSDAELSEFYSIAYRAQYKNQTQPKPKHIYRSGKLAMERLNKMRPFMASGMRHLDIGAGGGEFTYLAARHGLDAQGIDPNSGYLDFGREAYSVPLATKEIADLPTDEKFDVITLFHVLEHLAHPQDVVDQIHSLLKPNGIFVVEIPNLESKRTSPTNTYFKAHISYFTNLALQVLLAGRFKIEVMENTDVLFAICQKRDPIEQADTQELRRQSVALGNKRLKSKAMGEYLMNGGAFSVLGKISRISDEKSGTKGKEAKAILDDLFDVSAGAF